MKSILAAALLLSLTTLSFAETSKSEGDSKGPTGSQGVETPGVQQVVKNNTCTLADGTILNKTDKGYAKCMKHKMKKK